MPHSSGDFLANLNVRFECGFNLSVIQIVESVVATNSELALLPISLWRAVDLKSAGSIVGAYLGQSIALISGAIVNPIEKGHPDVLPASARGAKESALRNYPEGLEIKGTCGNVTAGRALSPGDNRCPHLVGITWQAHHQEVTQLLGIIWDFDTFCGDRSAPFVTAGFYSSQLNPNDWGAISGTTGRNTKVSGMRVSGKEKMARGAVFMIDARKYVAAYTRLLGDAGCLEALKVK